MAALAARQQELSQTISLLPPFLARASLRHRAGPLVRADEGVRPGMLPRASRSSVRRSPPALPWLAQGTLLMSPQELGGLVRYLTPAIQNTGATIAPTEALMTGRSAHALL